MPNKTKQIIGRDDKHEAQEKHQNLTQTQSGLGYFPEHAIYSTWELQKDVQDSHKKWQAGVKQIEHICCVEYNCKTVVMCGVGFEMWQAWSHQGAVTVPKGMGTKDKLSQLNTFLGNTPGDFFFHIKSDSAKSAYEVFEKIKEIYAGTIICKDSVVAQKKNHGKVFGGRFTDVLENPADKQDIAARVIIGDEDLSHKGGLFLITQEFVHDWDKINAMSEIAKENMIGRDRKDRIIPMDNEGSHIKRVRQVDGEKVNFRLMRQALTFGVSDDNKANEKGVFFAGYAQSTSVLDKILDGIAGSNHGFVQDQMFSVTKSKKGSYWYIPNNSECGLDENAVSNVEVSMNEFYNVNSKNGNMFYNTRNYQHKIRHSNISQDCPVSERIMLLVNKTFARWQTSWYKKRETPPLGHLRDYVAKDDSILTSSVTLRKGKATQLSLSKVLVDVAYAKRASLLIMDEADIIVGNMPQITLGTGTRVMEYLNDEEKLTGFCVGLNEYGMTGHNIPDYSLLCSKGIKELSHSFEEKLKGQISTEQKDFYQSVIWSLDGLSHFILAYADLAAKLAKREQYCDHEKKNFLEIEARMKRLAYEKANSLLDALQLIFITNCALHQIGETMSIGRLDQILINYLKPEDDRNKVQEIIDSFWIKMDETVLYNNSFMNDYLTYGTGAVFYSAGNFPQGAAVNQWVQQVTIGGYKANDAAVPEDGCNEITLMCLRSARRLPLNAPCLSLRVHKNMKDEIVKEAARAILSGGAHPVLLNDDKLSPALKECGLSVADSRDYACDGCYEVIVPGKTEWAFSYVPLLPMIDYTMNQGASIFGAGQVHLRGIKNSLNSPPAEEIKTFDQFMKIFYTHWKWAITKFFNTLMNSYGSLNKYSPSPLFSALLHDSLETGRDLSNGGAHYKIVSPMMCGIINVINSLYNIKKLVYDDVTARCNLPQLLRCLQCNWGFDMVAPFYSHIEGDARKESDALLFKDLRSIALKLPKFGVTRCKELEELGAEVVKNCCNIITETFKHPIPSIKEAYDRLIKKYSTKDREFKFVVTPGVGTFEDNLGVGQGIGASPDGRLSGQPICDDATSSPYPADLPFDPQLSNAFDTLKVWNNAEFDLISNAAPIDMNIHEDFPQEKLEELIKLFADSELGSNMITLTCADPLTFQKAQQEPDRYDLIRVRMGGWSEFYVAMYPEHQDYILRRPYYTFK